MLKVQKVTESLYIIGILIITPTADCTNTPFNCNVIGWNPCFSLGKNMHDNYRPQRSWGKVIFSQASVTMSTGGHAWLLGGVHGCGRARVVAGGGMHGCRGCTWLPGGAWLAGSVHGCGHTWMWGGMRGCRGGVCRARQDTVNERAVCILLECILVLNKIMLILY